MKEIAALVRLRQQQFDRAEQALAAANGTLLALETEEAALRAQMRKIDLPGEGDGRAIAALRLQRETLQKALAISRERLEEARREVARCETDLQRAHIALEQAKSMEAQALREFWQKRRRRMQNELDEIASQKFWRERREEGKALR